MPRALLRAHVAVGTHNISAGGQSQTGHGAHGPANLAEVVSSRCRDTLPQELTLGVRNGDSLRSISALHVCMFVKYRHTHAHIYIYKPNVYKLHKIMESWSIPSRLIDLGTVGISIGISSADCGLTTLWSPTLPIFLEKTDGRRKEKEHGHV